VKDVVNRNKYSKITLSFKCLAVWLLASLCFGADLALDRDAEAWQQQARMALARGDLAEAQRLAEQRLSDPSSLAAAHLLLGMVDLKQQRHLQSIAHFQLAKNSGLRGEELFEQWSVALQALGRIPEACQMLEETVSLDSSQTGLRRRLADLYLTQGKAREALPHLEQVYQQGLQNASIVLQLASARFAAGQDYRAVELLDPLIESTSSPNLLLQIGKLYFRNLLYRQATTPLERAWGISKPSYETGMYLALTHYQLEQYADGKRILEQIQPGKAEALEYHTLRGSIFARLGNWEDARRELTQAVASAENRADGYLNLGLFWLERGDRQRAWEQLEKGSRFMTPGTKVLYKLGTRVNCDGLSPPRGAEPKSRDRAEFFANLAESFHKSHHWVSALELFLLALEENPGLCAPYGGIGLICQELGSPEVGKSFLEQGIELHPNAPDLHFYLGTIHYALGRFDDAISSYQRALQLDGPKPPARHFLFLGISQAGASGLTQDKAKESFLRALEADPQLALAHYELGKWYLKNQEFDRAERSLQQAIELDPHLLGAYYQYGLACTRNGKTQKGQELMAAFQRKKALRESASPSQTQAERELATPEVR
jgi:tetratricopeptide (TPR) repeat protein